MKSILLATAALALTLPAFAAPAATEDDWRSEVLKKVEEKQMYTMQDRANGLEGSARVKLVVAADGTLTSAELLKSTGSAALDRNIVRNVQEVTFPALPAGMTSEEFVVPITYRLSDDRNTIEATGFHRAESLEAWKAEAHDKLQRFRDYPSELRSRGVEGDVNMRVRVNNRGRVVDAELLDDQADRDLSRAALLSVRRFSNLPALPEGTQDYAFSLLLHYRLQ